MMTTTDRAPFEAMVSEDWRPEIAICPHEWTANQCQHCGQYRLLPFQIEGARFLEHANGRGAIFDEMGLGKTIQVLAWLKYARPRAGRTLVLVKRTILYQWAAEVKRWLGIDPQIIEGSHDELDPDAQIYLMSYGLLVPVVKSQGTRLVSQGFDLEQFRRLEMRTVILDECQVIKNQRTRTTRMVERLVTMGSVRQVIPLSGTPWTNRGGEFFPVLHLLDPKLFPSYQAFLTRWVEWYWSYGFQRMGGIRDPEVFRAATKHLLIRRLRAEVLPELPAIQRAPYYCQIDPADQGTYQQMLAAMLDVWRHRPAQETTDFHARVMASLSRVRHHVGLAKVSATVDLATEFLEATDRKLIIFVQHVEVGRQIAAALSAWDPLRLTAELTAKERFELQQTFNTDPTARLLVASTLAGGEGMNLHTCADILVHERQWNPGAEEQAECRIVRIGQQANILTATYVMARGTYDVELHQLIELKRLAYHAAMNHGSDVPRWNEWEMVQAVLDTVAAGDKELVMG